MNRADADRSAALDQSRLDLDQRHVAMLGNQLPDKAGMRLNLARMPVAAAWPGNSLSMLQRKLPPADSTRGADAEMRRSRAATHSAVNRGNNPVPKIL